MRLVDQGVVFQGTAGSRTASCCFPSLAKHGERLVVSWRVGSSKDSADGTIYVSHSDDRGGSWSPPTQPWEGDCAGSGAGELRYAPLAGIDDRLWAAIMRVDRSRSGLSLFNSRTEGLLPVSTWLSRSSDGGESWDTPIDLGAGPLNVPSPLTGPIMRLPGDVLAMPFEVNKAYDDPTPWRHAAAFRLSRDGGRTWDECQEVMSDADQRRMFWDQHHARNTSGQHVAAFWVYDRGAGADSSIHLARARSNGLEWSRPWDTGIRGQVAHPVLFDDGRLLLVYVDRYGERGIYGKMSYDAGVSFAPQTLTLYQHPHPTQSAGETCGAYLEDMNLWTFGRIEGVRDGDSEAALVFYAGSSTVTRICWARVAV